MNLTKNSVWRYAASVGPGMVLLLSTIGPRDLISGTAAGANYGYSLLWTLVAIGFVRWVLLEAIARYVVATGETLLAGYRRVGAWAAWSILGSIVLKRYLSNLYHILLLGATAGMLLGITSPLATGAAALIACGMAFLLMYRGYQGVEKWSKPLALLLGGSLFIVAALSRPDVGEIARGLLYPAVPADNGGYGPMFMILVLVGSGVGSLSSLKYSAFVFEKGWRDPSHLAEQRFDLLVSVAGGFLLAALVQIAAAAVDPGSARFESFEDLVTVFTGTLGQAGKIALCTGLWATVFTTFIGSNTGYSLLAADLVVRPGENGGEAGFAERRRKVYRAFLIAFCVPPLAVLITEWKPIPLVLIASAMSAITVPVVVVILFILTRDRKVMGGLANGFGSNLAMSLIMALSAAVTWAAVMELIERYL